MSDEERKLRAIPPDMFLPANIFEEHAGHFWGILETRDYMRARYGVIEALMKVKTFEAIEAALEMCMENHRLCRGDNQGIRDITPHLMLRVGKDQECYDFIKWYSTTGQEGDYDWGDMDLPYLDVKNAYVLEPVDLYTRKYGDLSHTVAITLLKIRLLQDLKALQNSTAVGGKVPRELLDNIRGQLVSTIILGRKDIMDSDDQSERIQVLEKQVD